MRPLVLVVLAVAACGGRVGDRGNICEPSPPAWNLVAPDARELCNPERTSCQVCNSAPDECGVCLGATLFACQGGPRGAVELAGCMPAGTGERGVTFACCGAP